MKTPFFSFSGPGFPALILIGLVVGISPLSAEPLPCERYVFSFGETQLALDLPLALFGQPTAQNFVEQDNGWMHSYVLKLTPVLSPKNRLNAIPNLNVVSETIPAGVTTEQYMTFARDRLLSAAKPCWDDPFDDILPTSVPGGISILYKIILSNGVVDYAYTLYFTDRGTAYFVCIETADDTYEGQRELFATVFGSLEILHSLPTT